MGDPQYAKMVRTIQAFANRGGDEEFEELRSDLALHVLERLFDILPRINTETTVLASEEEIATANLRSAKPSYDVEGGRTTIEIQCWEVKTYRGVQLGKGTTCAYRALEKLVGPDNKRDPQIKEFENGYNAKIVVKCDCENCCD